MISTTMEEKRLRPPSTFLLGFLLVFNFMDVGDAIDPILPAMGRPALLGEFYDARNQSFLGVTLFRDDIPPEKLIKTIDTTQSDIKYGIVDSSKSKLFHLDVSAEIKVEMMSGKLKVSGSAAYFNEEKKSALEVEGFLQYKTRTKREVLNLLYDRMKPYLKLETLDKVEATHIVIAIEYGADVVIKFLNKVDSKEDQTKIQGALELAFTVEKISIAASASVNLEEGKEDKFSNFSLNVYGDINLGSTMPQNMKDVMKLINKVPEKLKENNDGKGVPMLYTLFPISTLAELVSNEKLQQKIVNDLDEAILNDFVKMFDKISRVQQELNDLEAKVKYYSNCTSGEDVARVETLNSKFSDAALQFKLEAREAMDTARVMTTPPGTSIEKPDKNLQPTEAPVEEEVEAVAYAESESQSESESENQEDAPTRKRRSISQKETRDLMKKVLLEYQSREFSVDKVAAKLETEFEAVLSKIELYKVFQRTGVEYFGRYGSFNNLRLQTSDRILYAIFMISSEGPEWENNWELFLNQLKRPFSHLAIVDCAFKDVTCAAIQAAENKTVMRQYYRTKMISKDVYSDLTSSKSSNGEKPSLIVSSVGRFHEIGDLYNARGHQFTGKSLLLPGTNLTKINMTTEDFSNETMEIVKNGFEEKFQVMGIQPPALQYNILINPKGFQGLGRTFLETRGFQPQWISSTLYHVYNTISESILDVDEESFDFISISRLLKGGATHFVKQIVWGAQTTISLSAPLPDQNNISSSITCSTSSVKELLPKARGDLVKIWDILTSKSKIEFGEEPTKISKIPLSPLNYEIKFASDIFQNARNEFRTEKDLVDFLNEFPRLKLKANKGKGRPVLYILYPLENLQQYFGVISGIPNDPTELENPALSLEFARVFEAFYEAEEKIGAMKKVFNSNKLYVTDETLDDFLGIERNFQRMKRQFLDKLRALVKDKDDEKIKEWLLQMKEGATGVKFFNATGNTIKFVALDKFSTVVQKLEFFQYFAKEHPQIKYVGREKMFIKEMQTYTSGEFVYVLFYRMELFAEKDPSWIDNFDLMTRHLTEKPYNKLILMDCDFEDESCKIIEKSVIHLFRNTQIISENVLEEWNLAMSRLLEKKAFPLQRRSIGRHVHLGALYNAKMEKLLDKNILNVQKIHGQSGQNLFTMIPALEKIESKAIESSDLAERYTALEMEPEVQLALLFQGQGKNLEGSAGFLDENLEFSKATIFTVEHNSAALNLDSKELPLFFQPNSLDESDEPTHYVKQIKFGSNTVFALGESAVDDDVQFLEKSLGSLEIPRVAAPESLTALQQGLRRRRTNDEGETRALSNLERLEDFKIFTDLALENQVKVIKGGNLTDLVHKISLKSKSFPFAYEISESVPSVSFILEPLESLQRPLGILSPSYKYQSLPETFQVSHVVEKYQAFQRALNETRHLETELLSPSFKIGMSNASLEKIEEIHHDFIDSFTKFKIRFRDELEAVKNGSRINSEPESASSESKLKEILAEFKDVLTTGGKYARLEELKPEQEKLKFLKYISGQSGAQTHITYLGRDRNFNDIVFSSAPTKYVLYFKDLINLAADPLWLNTTDIFFKLAVQGEECFIIDCDFPVFNCSDLPKPVIHQYQDGVLTSSDYAVTVIIKTNQTATELDHQQKWLKNLQDKFEDLDKNFQVEQAAVETIRGKLNENVEVVTKHLDDFSTVKQNLTGAQQKLEESLTSVTTEISQIGENFQNSLVLVQGNLSKLESASTTSLETLNVVQEKLNDSLVPLGFIYIQYMKQLAPQEIWPQFVWSDVSPEYAGLFFRTDGGTALSFDSYITQEENSPRIYSVSSSYSWSNSYPSSFYPNYDSYSEKQVFIGKRYDGGDKYTYLGLTTNGVAEVRPQNQAIRIWKRVANSSQVISSSVKAIRSSPRSTHYGTWGSWEYCPEGQFVIGFQLKTEAWVAKVGADNSGLNGISLLCHDNSTLNANATDSLSITSKMGEWGSWGKKFWCPGKERAIGFQLRAQVGGAFKSNDTTKGWGSSGKNELGAANLKLICRSSSYLEGDGVVVGEYSTEKRCPASTALCGIQTQVEDYKLFADYTALNNVDMACCSE